MADNMSTEVVAELSDEAINGVSGGHWVPRWVTVYEVIRHSDPPVIVATFNTRQEAEAYVHNWNGHHVEEHRVRK